MPSTSPPQPFKYSNSFVISNNCLDTCPKCGQNVCEHTSIADVINLPNSVSQDFSTYSSDSSLIKQLFNDSPAANANIANLNNRISLTAINQSHYFQNNFFKLNNRYYDNHPQINNFYTYNSKLCHNKSDRNNLTINNFMPSYTLRPLSCQVMIIDNDTSDKLIRDFFDTKNATCYKNKINDNEQDEPINMLSDKEHKLDIDENQKEMLAATTVATTPSKKKIKFSNFRLFLKSSHKDSTKSSSSHRPILKSSGLVNCLTSSTSSSSCEEIHLKLKASKNTKKQSKSKAGNMAPKIDEIIDSTNVLPLEVVKDEKGTTTTTTAILVLDKKIASSNIDFNNLNKSIISLNSKYTHEIDYEDDYNEMKNLEFCPIAVRDIDEEDEYSTCISSNTNQQKSKQLTESINTTDSSSSTQTLKQHLNNETNQTTTSSMITVPLNNSLSYNYEKKRENESQNCFNENQNSKKVTIKYLLSNNQHHYHQRPVSTSVSTHQTSQENNQLINTNQKCISVSQNALESSMCLDNDNYLSTKANKPGALAPLEKMSNIISSLSYNTISIENNPTNTNNINNSKPDNNNIDEDEASKKLSGSKRNFNVFNNHKNHFSHFKNRSSFFSSCSSCETTSVHSTTLTTNSSRIETQLVLNNPKLNKNINNITTNNSNNKGNNVNTISSTSTCTTNTTLTTRSSSTSPSFICAKYHSISIIFILIGLFTFNVLQESFLIFYYFNTNQFYGFICSVVALFIGQLLVLFLSLLADIDLIRLTQPFDKCGMRNKAAMRQENLNISDNTNIILNEKLYSIFKSPFSKLLLLVPGYLIVAVFIQFFTHVFNYRKASGHSRFILEFQLSLILFLNGIFHSLPLAMVNSCFLAYKTKSYSFQWYYTELFSILTSSYSYLTSFTSSSSSLASSSSTTASSSALSTKSSSSTSILLDDKNIERRNLLVLLLVSIFISISIGICLFTTYFELMKQMNYLSMFRNNLYFNFNKSNKKRLSTSNKLNKSKNDKKRNISNETGIYITNKKSSKTNEENNDDNTMNEHNLVLIDKHNKMNSDETSTVNHSIDHAPRISTSSSKIFNLGIVEILVYFCYRFCLISSRLAVIGLFFYMFDHWLLIAFVAHVFLGYMLTIFTLNIGKLCRNKESDKSKGKQSSFDNKEGLSKLIDSSSSSASSSNSNNYINNVDANISSKAELAKLKSILYRYLTPLMISLLSFVELFMNQISELYHIKKVLTYYLLYFMQNVSLLTYWLISTIINARKQHPMHSKPTVPRLNKEPSDLMSVLFKKSSLKPSQMRQPNQETNFFQTSIGLQGESTTFTSSNMASNDTASAYACYATLIYLCIILLTIFGLILKFLHLHIIRKRFRKLYD